MSLTQKKVLLGVTGGIAAYKAAELLRRLRELGAEVKVVMTRAACEFVGPLTFQSLSGHAVHVELFHADGSAGMEHIDLARWCDMVVVAPASADYLAKLAHGFADDLLSTLSLVTTTPIFVAPSMNREMWLARATQDNVSILEARSVCILGPAEGDQACGEIGPGRMLEPSEILEHICRTLVQSALSGTRILVTAGPTREPIDPIRYISNRSSGKMGYAIARAAAELGASVTLISGPVAVPPPKAVACVSVTSADHMQREVFARIGNCDVFIAAAAVADYRCATPFEQKLKRGEGALCLSLIPTPDIVGSVAKMPKRPFTVAFAAETENLLANAENKLKMKEVDIIVANDVGTPGVGFDTDENELHVIWRGGHEHLPRQTKVQLARRLLDIIAEHYCAKNPS